MRRLHLIFGILVFVVFVVTGRYMLVDFPDKGLIPLDLRLLMRSRHIYIFFSAMIHLALGIYLQITPQRWRRGLQYFGSILLVCLIGVFIWAFVVEKNRHQHFSSLNNNGI